MQLEYYNGKLCISYDELTGGEEPLVREGTLYSWISRKRVRQERKAFGYGVTALIDYKTLPRRVQEAFEERYGDPRELVVREAKGEAKGVARPNRPAPRRSTLGEVLKEESLMDYGELWAKRQQGSRGKRISKY